MAAKATAAHRAGLTAIVCIGETLAERKAGQTLRRVGAQLRKSLPGGANPDNTVIAYEPVWAIGTGLTPTAKEVAAVHRHIRNGLIRLLGEEAGAQVRILYGGSMKPENASELLDQADIDGGLIGGASLKAKSFLDLIEIAHSK